MSRNDPIDGAPRNSRSLSLTGPDGLLKGLTKAVLETVLNEEMTEHLGHERGGQPLAGNVGNGTGASRC